MAIFIFNERNFFAPAKHRLTLGILTIGLLFGRSAWGAGYLISAQDRAQATILSQQAYVTFQSGDYSQALGLLTQSDQLRPDQPDGWNLRGVIYLKLKDYQKAQASLSRAIALDPEFWAAQFNLAEVFFQHKDFARARSSFEHLLSHTDRFKEKKKWELVQYKAIVCAVLSGDERGATKKLAKLPATGGATPALLYAQAALAFQGRNPAQAQKSILAAQATFPATINDLFSDSLVQAGWETPPVSMAALAANVPSSPNGSRGYVTIDPQLQADSAGPLPVADAPGQPIVTMINPAEHYVRLPVGRPKRPAVTVAAEVPPATPSPKPEGGLDSGDLLLD